MNRVEELKTEIKQLEIIMNQLKKELKNLQKNCIHDFKAKDTIQECSKCSLIESLSW
ncbi:hypothetical protein [Gottfriedia luciferensis]|uniref:hypothetical protein n=1 Tax=Gottfriedia luciferensis TaxID=178774 RepID=UPI00130281D8|nr:hypothetical protein [Gottfriedia luciferensis]